MEIRPLRETDSRLEIGRIYEVSWKFVYQGVIPQAYLNGIPAGLWTQALDGRDSLVLTERGAPAGTACVCPSRWPDWPDFGEVVSLYLLPEYMGRGYGGPLLEAAVKMLAEQGFQNVLLWVLEENRRARRFYEKHGFCPAGAFMEQEIGGTSLREVLYLRHVN